MIISSTAQRVFPIIFFHGCLLENFIKVRTAWFGNHGNINARIVSTKCFRIAFAPRENFYFRRADRVFDRPRKAASEASQKRPRNVPDMSKRRPRGVPEAFQKRPAPDVPEASQRRPKQVPKAQGSRPKAQGSRLKAHGSRPKAQGSRLKAQGSRPKAQSPRLKAQGLRFNRYQN